MPSPSPLRTEASINPIEQPVCLHTHAVPRHHSNVDAAVAQHTTVTVESAQHTARAAVPSNTPLHMPCAFGFAQPDVHAGNGEGNTGQALAGASGLYDDICDGRPLLTRQALLPQDEMILRGLLQGML